MHYTTCCYGIPVSLIQTIVFSTATPKSIFSLYFDSSLFCLNICGALQPPFLQLFFLTSQDQNLSWTLVHGCARIQTNVCIYWQMPKYEHECIEIKSGKHTHTHLHIYTFFQHPLSLYTLVQQSLRQITVGPASMSPNSQSYSTYPSKPWQTAM